jgi:hypothetical protein
VVKKTPKLTFWDADRSAAYIGVSTRRFRVLAEEWGVKPIKFPTDRFRSPEHMRVFFWPADVEKMKQRRKAESN